MPWPTAWPPSCPAVCCPAGYTWCGRDWTGAWRGHIWQAGWPGALWGGSSLPGCPPCGCGVCLRRFWCTAGCGICCEGHCIAPAGRDGLRGAVGLGRWRRHPSAAGDDPVFRGGPGGGSGGKPVVFPAHCRHGPDLAPAERPAGQGPAAAHDPLGAGDGRRCLLGGHGPGRDPAAAPLWDFSPDCRRGNAAAQIGPAPFREISRSHPCIMDGGKEAEP